MTLVMAGPPVFHRVSVLFFYLSMRIEREVRNEMRHVITNSVVWSNSVRFAAVNQSECGDVRDLTGKCSCLSALKGLGLRLSGYMHRIFHTWPAPAALAVSQPICAVAPIGITATRERCHRFAMQRAIRRS